MSIVPAFFNRTESIRPLFDDVDVSEIAVNGPGVVWAGRKGMRFMERVDTPVLTESTLRDFAELVAHHSDQETDAKRPLLAASIPSELTGPGNRDFRIQVVQPPAVPPGTIAIAIRKPSTLDLTMQYYEESGAFRRVNEPLPDAEDTGRKLAMLYRDGNWPAFLRLAVKAKKGFVAVRERRRTNSSISRTTYVASE